MTNSNKVTKATFKSFIRKNAHNLEIMPRSRFNSSEDGVRQVEGSGFHAAVETTENTNYTLGLHGIWLVGGGRDYFEEFNENGYTGIRYFNCCGSAYVGVKTESLSK